MPDGDYFVLYLTRDRAHSLCRHRSLAYSTAMKNPDVILSVLFLWCRVGKELLENLSCASDCEYTQRQHISFH